VNPGPSWKAKPPGGACAGRGWVMGVGCGGDGQTAFGSLGSLGGIAQEEVSSRRSLGGGPDGSEPPSRRRPGRNAPRGRCPRGNNVGKRRIRSRRDGRGAHRSRVGSPRARGRTTAAHLVVRDVHRRRRVTRARPMCLLDRRGCRPSRSPRGDGFGRREPPAKHDRGAFSALTKSRH